MTRLRPFPGLPALAVAMAVAGCAHAPPPAVATPAPGWPAPPAAPRLRQAAGGQVGAVARPPTPWWRDALDWIAGAEDGGRDQGLVRPFDVALAEDGTMLVADPDGAQVLRFDARGAFAASLACAGRAWGSPVSVAAEGEQVFVSDAGTAAVVRWTASGCSDLGAGDLARPAGLALAPGRILVTDPPAHQVVVLRRDGTLEARWGTQGDGAGQLHFPTDVAVAADGTAFVVDAFNFRVAHLAADGAWLGAFGAPGDEDGAFLRPKGIALGAAGEIYVSDAQKDQVLVFSAAGAFQFAAGGPGAAPGQLTHPAGLSAAGNRLAVADSLNRRIQVYEILGARP